MTFLAAYKIFAALLLLFCVLLLWPLSAASRRVKKEIQELEAQGHHPVSDGSARIHGRRRAHLPWSARKRS